MLKVAVKRGCPNIKYEYGDIANLKFNEAVFDRVTARMVFHHLDGIAEKSMSECFRILKNNGLMVVSEGIPPHPSLKGWYSDMFRLKEKRLVFLKEDLIDLMKSAGFRVVEARNYVSRKMSIVNWLENSATPREVKKKIFNMHLSLDRSGKRMYNFKLKDNDILVDFKYAIIVGKKAQR